MLDKKHSYEYHRFLDEAGDSTFFGKGKRPIVGDEGVSKCFILGMLKVKEDTSEVRQKVELLQKEIIEDRYYNTLPSIKKKIESGRYFLHATDDIPEVREKFYKFIDTIDCSFEAVVGRKIYDIFSNKHNNKEVEFYADLLSHLIKNKFSYNKLVLNIAHRGQSTSNKNLEFALDKAIFRAKKINENSKIVFNVQTPLTEPLLNIADYFCWAVQKVFERGETRYYDFLQDKISLVVDIYDSGSYVGNKNYYTKNNRLTKSNLLK